MKNKIQVNAGSLYEKLYNGRHYFLLVFFIITVLFYYFLTRHLVENLNKTLEARLGIQDIRKLLPLSHDVHELWRNEEFYFYGDKSKESIINVQKEKILKHIGQLNAQNKNDEFNIRKNLLTLEKRIESETSKKYLSQTELNSVYAGLNGMVLETIRQIYYSSRLGFDRNIENYYTGFASAIGLPGILECMEKIHILMTVFFYSPNYDADTFDKTTQEIRTLENHYDHFYVESSFFSQIEPGPETLHKLILQNIREIKNDYKQLTLKTAFAKAHSLNPQSDYRKFNDEALHYLTAVESMEAKLLKQQEVFLTSEKNKFSSYLVLIVASACMVFGLWLWYINSYFKYKGKSLTLLDAVSQGRRELLYSDSIARVYLNLCKSLVGPNKYKLAWIGLAVSDEKKTVYPVAWYGEAYRYAEKIVVTWGDGPHSQGPTGICIKKNEIQICNDVLNDPSFGPWKENAMEHGIRSSATIPLVEDGNVVGALSLYSSQKNTFTKSELSIIRELIDDSMFNIYSIKSRKYKDLLQMRLSVDNEQLKNEVNERTKTILEIQDGIVFSLSALVESRDQETGNHIVRTREYIKTMLDAMAADPVFQDQLSPEIIEEIYKSSPLHDIGKVGIPDKILSKAGPLTETEYNIMKTHTIIGARAITSGSERMSKKGFLKTAEVIIRHHHEKWDGSGYPDQLKGSQIPLAARVMSIADSYDALISKRVYKDSYSHEKAVEIIEEEGGSKFDPDLVRIFLALQDQFKKIARQYNDNP